MILRRLATKEIIEPEIGIRIKVYNVSLVEMVFSIKKRPKIRAGSLNSTVTELITEFSIC